MITSQQVIDLVMTRPPDRLASIYDFAMFVKGHPLPSSSEFTPFGETEEEIQADEERWDLQFAESRDELRMMAREVAADYRAGRTKAMDFTPDGRLVR
jgi:hypothetical protein